MRLTLVRQTSAKTTAFQFAIAVGPMARSIRRVIGCEREVLLTLRLPGGRAGAALTLVATILATLTRRPRVAPGHVLRARAGEAAGIGRADRARGRSL
jgi:hypothetical protein